MLRVGVEPATKLLPVQKQLAGQLLLKLHLPKIVLILVLEPILGEHLDGVLILLRLHRYYVVVLLLLLKHLLV